MHRFIQGETTHGLVCFCTTLVTGVRCHNESWLDFSAAGDNTSHSEEGAYVLCTHLSDGNILGSSVVTYIHLTVTSQLTSVNITTSLSNINYFFNQCKS